jgi:hypothetical protein
MLLQFIYRFLILKIRSSSFCLVLNKSLHHLIVQLVNGIPHQTNKLMPYGSCLTNHISTICGIVS